MAEIIATETEAYNLGTSINGNPIINKMCTYERAAEFGCNFQLSDEPFGDHQLIPLSYIQAQSALSVTYDLYDDGILIIITNRSSQSVSCVINCVIYGDLDPEYITSTSGDNWKYEQSVNKTINPKSTSTVEFHFKRLGYINRVEIYVNDKTNGEIIYAEDTGINMPI